MRAISGLLVGAALCVTGCVDNDQSFTIERFLAIDSDCLATPTSTLLRDRGLLDIGVVAAGTRGYVLVPVVQNNLPARMLSGTEPVIATDAIQVRGVDVELVLPPGLSLPPEQTQFFYPAAAGRLSAGGGAATMFVEVLSASAALSLAGAVPDNGTAPPPLLMARVRPVGERAGDSIVGAWVEFPIELCKFCLSLPQAPCPQGGFPKETVLEGGCFPQQDEPITCCTSQLSPMPLCGPQVPTA